MDLSCASCGLSALCIKHSMLRFGDVALYASEEQSMAFDNIALTKAHAGFELQTGSRLYVEQAGAVY